MFRSFGPGEAILLVLVLAIVLGWKRLPDAARSLGRSMRILKSEVEQMKDDGQPAKREALTGDVVTPRPAAAQDTPVARAPAPAAPPKPSGSGSDSPPSA